MGEQRSAGGWVDISRAAVELGRSPVWVRQMAAAGDLPSRKLGGVWLVDLDAVLIHAHAPRPAGRPVSARMCWLVLLALEVERSGRAPSFWGGLDKHERHRLRSLLGSSAPVAQWGGWLRRRAAPARYSGHRSAVPQLLRERAPVQVGGAAGAAAGGWPVSHAEPEQLYVAAADVDEVARSAKLQVDADGHLVLMVVPDVAVEVLVREVDGAPLPWPSAVALVDLLEAADPRDRHTAEVELGHLLAAARAGSAVSA